MAMKNNASYARFIELCLREAFPSWDAADSLGTNIVPYLWRLLFGSFAITSFSSWFWAPHPAAILLTIFGLLAVLYAPYRVWVKTVEVVAQRDEEMAQLQEARAVLDVVVVSEYRGHVLEVTNNGERGELQAQIEVIEGANFIHGVERPTLPTYTGYWERSAGPIATLSEGHKDRVMIASLDTPQGGLMLFSYKLYFYNAVQQRLAQFGTTSWVPGKDSGTIPAKFRLKITISSSRRMKGGPFVKEYILGEGGFEEAVATTSDAEAVAPYRQGLHAPPIDAK